MPFPAYRFRAVTPPDLSLIRKWLSRGHVQERWGDPVRALATIADNMVDPAMNLFIVEWNDLPIDYIQSWDPHAEADHPATISRLERAASISSSVNHN